MITKKTITCVNSDNVSLTFGDRFEPFLLEDAEGLYEFNADVSVIRNGNGDGGTFSGSQLGTRNIVLTLRNKDKYAVRRNVLYQLFKPKSIGTLVYSETDEDGEDFVRFIRYQVESVQVDGTSNARVSTISLICADPLFKDLYDTLIEMSSWINQFEFPHEFQETGQVKDPGEEISSLKKEKITRIEDDYTVSNIGMIITMKADDTVQNPKMVRVEDGTYIQIGTDQKPLSMVHGDQIIISTIKNNKNVWFIHKGVKTPVNEYIEEGSTYIQLKNGENTFRYFAKSGEDNLLVSIAYRKQYLGV